MKIAFILIALYWGSDGRTSMTSAQFQTEAACKAAIKAMSGVMNPTISTGMTGVYAVCVPNG